MKIQRSGKQFLKENARKNITLNADPIVNAMIMFIVQSVVSNKKYTDAKHATGIAGVQL